MSDQVKVEGLVLKRNGQLVLLIPLEEGGDELVQYSQGISEVENGFLRIVIPEWLAGVLRIEEGDLVLVNNASRKFGIQIMDPPLVH